MAKIYPFTAIHPNPIYADQLVFTKSQSESVAGNTMVPEALPPLKTLLETGARQRPETAEGQALAYQDINETFTSLLETGRLWPDSRPCMYVYEVGHGLNKQTGIWAVTSLEDPIKTHELTFDESVRRIRNYRAQTGLEGSPILLTYPPDRRVNAIITEAKCGLPDVHYENPSGTHHLWRVDSPEILRQLTDTFAEINDVYLADGHHRKRSAKLLLKEQRAAGSPLYETISALYMSTSELRIRQYYRAVIPEQPVDKGWLFKQLQPDFCIKHTCDNEPVEPWAEKQMGLYIGGEWYHLTARPDTAVSRNMNGLLDVSILQDHILARLFQILDPGTDPRLKHAGGEKAIAEMEAIFRAHPRAIGFTLFPMTVEQLTKAADEGFNLPPKSTWIDPKIPYGLLLFKH
ncbi:DUF1015 family protein [Mucilaginibacter sp. KACC 22773]|uniref:DUF1015 family protein n=1 Tax=Mucilaginibacter sp. KACC 22773 TaxID=3025671 RepID=UPI0023662CC4|nr:DUF1015 family protein [Mucilaginibacter sp. KACC 22773]WDF77157.1 DUF1015 family protein [Mucilaginibacter sp. KACC 22773]